MFKRAKVFSGVIVTRWMPYSELLFLLRLDVDEAFLVLEIGFLIDVC